MARVEEIRQKRERAFYKNRMKGNKDRQIALDKKLVESNPELLRMREVEIAKKLAKEELRQAREQEQEMSDDDEVDMESDEEMESESEQEEIKQKVLLKNKKRSTKRTVL